MVAITAPSVMSEYEALRLHYQHVSHIVLTLNIVLTR